MAEHLAAWSRPRRTQVRLRLPGAALTVLAGAVLAGALPLAALEMPGSVRGLIAALVAANLAVVALVRPRAGIGLTLLFLVLLGMVRRLLIPAAGWSAFDPLLTVGPVLALLLTVKAVFAHRLKAPDLLSRLVVALVVFTLVEVLNPGGNGVVANTVGMLFIGAPLLWFFVGQSFGDRALVARLLPAALVLAALVAVYGLLQTFAGLPAWDDQWVAVTSYASLRVSHTVRAFGSFPSAAEYAAFLGAGMVMALGSLTRRRALALLLVPLLAVALFLESSRGILIFTAFATLVSAALRTGRGRRAWVVFLCGLAVVLVAGRLATPAAQSAAEAANDPLVTHQVAGLTDPLNPDNSTLLLHWEIVATGAVDSIGAPLGFGPAATNLAGARTGGDTSGAEVDVVNEFIALGVIGGGLLVAVIAITLSRAARLALRTRDPVMVAVTGVLIVTLGQWLNGGFYAMSALVWLLAGVVNRSFVEHRAARAAAAAAEG